jgi:serine-type D-Ala-D-Ala carboxypeptidase
LTLHGDGNNFREGEDLLHTAQHAGEIPGCVALVRRHGTTVFHEAFGWAALEPERRPMQLDTIFDLASLTKPLATTPLVLQLVAREMIALDDPVSRYLPAMAAFADGRITIRQLLTHTSGLAAWLPLYIYTQNRHDVVRIIAATEPECAPGSQVVYSCPGFIVLGRLVEELSDSRLDEAASHLLFAPLGVRDAGYGPQIDAARCARTERGNRYEEAMVAQDGLHFEGWRDDCLPGTVHDGNAWYALGGISGNAGLFGTAHDVGVLGQMWLDAGRGDAGRVLPEWIVQAATSDQTERLNEARGLGWQINRPSRDEPDSTLSSAGSELSSRAFGHTGFTGTSVWIDPDLDLVAVLLTNRVHPTVGDRAVITGIRRRFHDAVAKVVRAGRVDTAI